MELNTPLDVGLPHDQWRPHQKETTQWLLERKGTAIIEAPTGSGKTAYARAQAEVERTVALVRTKFLQEANYEQGYGFVPLYGKGNYPCVFEEANYGAMADECAFSEEGMLRCPQSSQCPYIQQRNMAKNSKMTVLNYAYWFNTYNRWPAPEVLLCDEAHQLSSLTLEWAGCSIDEKVRRRYDLPSFPIISSRGGSSTIGKKMPSPHERALSWLRSVSARLSALYDKASSNAETDPDARKEARKIELMRGKVDATLDALRISDSGWYIRSGPGVSGSNEWGFVVKPLTARYHFPTYFMRDEWRLAVMSATIGSDEVFAEELGLGDYEFLQIPNIWQAKHRPIIALDVPRLGHKSPQSAYDKQADEIAKAIKGCDHGWSGIIHTTSIAETERLGARLMNRGLADRIVIGQRGSTNQTVSNWHQTLRRKPNSILVSWALWEGYDGTLERINIVAKTPYPYLGDQYEVERQRFDGKFFLQRTAWQMEQGLGRTRRGKKSDYDTDDESHGLVAIADGGWKWIRKYISKSTLDAIRDESK